MMESQTIQHVSVLKKEAIYLLNPVRKGVYVDATLGRAGHTLALLKKLDASSYVIAFDQDAEAISQSHAILEKSAFSNWILIKNNFKNLTYELAKLKINHIQGILFDLGVSTNQLATSKRGFSYLKDGPLDMRMDQNASLTAADVVNNYSFDELAHIFKVYGEERHAKLIANIIVQHRKKTLFVSTLQLVQVIKDHLPAVFLKQNKHPCRRIFQAIRIEVNQELANLEYGLQQAVLLLDQNARLAVISFHSLEDRIVKHFFKQITSQALSNNHQLAKIPMVVSGQSAFKVLCNKVIKPSTQEIKSNPKARSAHLRVLERIKEVHYD